VGNYSTYYSAGVKMLCSHAVLYLFIFCPPLFLELQPIEGVLFGSEGMAEATLYELAEGISFKTFLERRWLRMAIGRHTRGYFEHAGVYVGSIRIELQERLKTIMGPILRPISRNKR